MPEFEHQDCAATLDEGIAEYYRSYPGLARGEALSPAAREFFRCHDAAHVVFGCGTDLDDEAVVKLASMFGTTAGVGVLEGYRLHESIDIYRKLRLRDMLRTILHATWLVPRTSVRCLRQRRRWPWSAFDAYARVPLRDLRAEFGIRVAHAQISGEHSKPGD